MALNFNKGRQVQMPVTDLEIVARKYDNYRRNLLFLVAFTVVNIVFVLLNTDYYMLFSASVPFYSVFLSMLFADKLPAEYYMDYETGEVLYFNIPGADIFLAVAVVVAVITLGLYVLMWFLSKKSYVPLIVATVMFVADTLGLLLIAVLFGASSFISDFILHVVVLVILGMSIFMGVKKKKLERKAAARRGLDEAEQTDEEGEKLVLKECEHPVSEEENAVSEAEKDEMTE